MSPARLSTAQRAAIDRGWSAADVPPDEYVDDAWIAANTRPAKAPSKVRHAGGRVLAAARTIGVDPLEGAEQADLSGLLPKLPRPIRRALIQRGGLTRDQMRRIAHRTGYPVIEAWSGHNKGSMKGVWGALVHHTGTPWSLPGDYPTLRVVRDGRPGLENSLCAFGLGRSGTIYLVNDKVSWHAGVGEYNGVTDGNGYMAGIEAESDGKNWTAEERDCYPRLVASILIEIGQGDPRPGVGDRWTTRHASYALPRGRKSDASGLDLDLFWRQVYGYLANPASITRGGAAPAPSPSPAPAPAEFHTVASGNTLSGIARQYGVTVDQVKSWNGLTSDTIQPGQRLRVRAAAAPAPTPGPVGDTLSAGGVLRPGQSLVMHGWSAVMQGDGNFVVYANGRVQWSTRTDGNPGAWLAMQTDGNLVIYSAAGRPLWNTRTDGKGGRRLVMQADGNLVIYRADNRPVWSRS